MRSMTEGTERLNGAVALLERAKIHVMVTGGDAVPGTLNVLELGLQDLRAELAKLRRFIDEEHKTALFIDWRREHKPTMRRESPVGLTKNTTCTRTYECICGAWDTESAKWRQTRHVAEFVAKHNRECWPVGR